MKVLKRRGNGGGVTPVSLFVPQAAEGSKKATRRQDPDLAAAAIPD